VSDLTEDQKVDRELALIKVSSKTSTNRSEIMQIVDIFRGRIVDVAHGSLIVEVTGPTEKIDSMLTLLRPFGIKEMVRTGLVAMTRGAATVQQAKQPTPTRASQASREPQPDGLTHQLSA
jgi:acetolactate synthase-1/3 small subunit